MRIDLDKLIFIGPARKKEIFLSLFQEASLVQFEGGKVSASDLLQSDFQEVIQAIKILKQYQVPQTPHVALLNPITFAHDVIAIKQKHDECLFHIKAMEEELETVFPFGKVPFDDIQAIEASSTLRLRLWIAHKKVEAETLSSHLIPLTTHGVNQYFASFTKEEIDIPALREIPVTCEMATLHARIRHAHKESEELFHELKRKASLVESLKFALVDSLNVLKKEKTKNLSLPVLEERLFSFTGWAPSTKFQDVENLASSVGVFVERVSPQENEIPPTYLENEGPSRIGEDLVEIYDTPAATDKDPSPWIITFFSLFFAMIVDDAGYGLIFLLLAFLLHKKIPKTSETGRRFVKLTTILGISCVVVGLCSHSFFSMTLSEHNILRKMSPMTYIVETRANYHYGQDEHEEYKAWVTAHGGIKPKSLEEFLYQKPSPHVEPLFDQLADKTMLELVLLIGSIHIILSIFRYLPRNIGNFGWVLFIIGGYLFAPYYLHATSFIHYLFHIPPELGGKIGLQLLGAGVLFAVIAAIVQRGITGIFELMTGVQIFSDILSYLRIYALGLSGLVIGGMINETAARCPFIVAVLVLISFHAVNLIMNITGGVIHGLRLNFLEWYHYSFDGGGRRFYPLNLEKHQ